MYFKSVFLQSYWVIDRTASKSLFIFVIVDHQSHHFIVTLNATFLAVGLKVAVIGLVKNNFKRIFIFLPKIIDFLEVFKNTRI